MTTELTNAEKAALAQDEISSGDDTGEVKGPDPKVWGHDKDRPSPESSDESAGVQRVGMRGDDGELVKGPDPEQHPRNN